MDLGVDMELFQTLTVEDARECLKQYLKLKQDGEKVFLEEAYGRYLLKEVLAQEDIPSFDRSTMDGFAVHASDTFSAIRASDLHRAACEPHE